jgi:hypothetical protein
VFRNTSLKHINRAANIVLKEYIALQNAPVINLLVYQDGTASPAALGEFAAIRKAVKGS